MIQFSHDLALNYEPNPSLYYSYKRLFGIFNNKSFVFNTIWSLHCFIVLDRINADVWEDPISWNLYIHVTEHTENTWQIFNSVFSFTNSICSNVLYFTSIPAIIYKLSHGFDQNIRGTIIYFIEDEIFSI